MFVAIAVAGPCLPERDVVPFAFNLSLLSYAAFYFTSVQPR
jgi:hypothetical protein